jgi:Ca2+-binding EF-hand superfamily protein
MLSGDQRTKLEEIFRAIDTDDSGYIDPDEFREALQKLVGDFPEEFLQNLLQHFDTDGDGKINLEELLNLLAFVDQTNQLP